MLKMEPQFSISYRPTVSKNLSHEQFLSKKYPIYALGRMDAPSEYSSMATAQ